LPALFGARASVRSRLRERVARNREVLVAALAGTRGEALRAEAGWCAIVRAPGCDESEIALALLDRDGVVVQPGARFDLAPAGAAHWVVSLLPEPERFDRGVAALARLL